MIGLGSDKNSQTLDGPESLPNGIKDYSELTGCGDGFTGPWIRDVCTDYEGMKV